MEEPGSPGFFILVLEASTTRRGNLWTDREALAAYLTKERDALEDELATIARAKGHDRHWARSFFRTRRVRPPKNDANDGGGGTT